MKGRRPSSGSLEKACFLLSLSPLSLICWEIDVERGLFILRLSSSLHPRSPARENVENFRLPSRCSSLPSSSLSHSFLIVLYIWHVQYQFSLCAFCTPRVSSLPTNQLLGTLTHMLRAFCGFFYSMSHHTMTKHTIPSPCSPGTSLTLTFIQVLLVLSLAQIHFL